MRQYLARFDHGIAINVVYLVPHNALRLETMGFFDPVATAEELKKMQELMDNGMRESAAGVSVGLDYFPSRCSNTEELIAICKVLRSTMAYRCGMNEARTLD